MNDFDLCLEVVSAVKCSIRPALLTVAPYDSTFLSM